jgi:L-rhamnose mutarotase
MESNNRFYYVLDLKPEDDLISEYERYHQAVWPEIESHILSCGVVSCEIFRFGHRLMMQIEVDESYSSERKEQLDRENPKVQEWETLMWKFQQSIPGSPLGNKWQRMDLIYRLKK